MSELVDALRLIFRNCRFDLIFKYLYSDAYARGDVILVRGYEEMYCESIRAFNGFYEEEPSKESREDFLNAFNLLIESVRENGYDQKESIPVSASYALQNGAHRVSVAASLRLLVPVEICTAASIYDYKLFMKHRMNPDWMDFGALKFLEINPDAYIVNLHSVSPLDKDLEVEGILDSYGFIFYKKEVLLSFNGYVNVKKISYGIDSSDHVEAWIGSYCDGFAGAHRHASQSFVDGRPLRAYVFVCDQREKVLKAKEEIRELLGLGNVAVHINDTKSEALSLGRTLLNDRSIQLVNYRPYDLDTSDFDSVIDTLRESCAAKNYQADRLAVTGSGVLAAYGLRKARDCDLVHAEELPLDLEKGGFSSHKSQEVFYSHDFSSIVTNPKYYFYYRGVKFVALEEVRSMKASRDEKPKDVQDVLMIDALEFGDQPTYVEAPVSVRRYFFGAIIKEKYMRHRVIRLLGLKVFKYNLHSKRR